MKSRITRFSVHQTSKTLALVYGVISLIITPIMVVVSLSQPVDESVPPILWLFFPILYACAAYVGFAIILGLYNFIAKKAGGIEFQTEAEPPAL